MKSRTKLLEKAFRPFKNKTGACHFSSHSLWQQLFSAGKSFDSNVHFANFCEKFTLLVLTHLPTESHFWKDCFESFAAIKYMKPVDCHCHLEFEKFDDDRDEVVERARRELEFAVTVGCNPERNEKTIEISERYENVVPNLGLHPTYTDDFDRVEEVKKQIRENDPAAIGEIGLDHHHIKEEKVREEQRKVFRDLLELAEEMDRPVNVHSREAEQEVIDTLDEYDVEALIHCFNGTPEQAIGASENGVIIGVTTQVLYSSRVQEIVETLDLESIVLETDSPFLYRGERNEPVNVVESAEKIAEIKEVSKEEVVEKTTENAQELFGLD
jgi:TatD DNase family protein